MSYVGDIYQLDRPPFSSVRKLTRSRLRFDFDFLKVTLSVCVFQREFHKRFASLVGPLSLFEAEEQHGKYSEAIGNNQNKINEYEMRFLIVPLSRFYNCCTSEHRTPAVMLGYFL